MNNEREKAYIASVLEDAKSDLWESWSKFKNSSAYYRFEEPYVVEGITLSRNTCRQLQNVNPTPWMNLLAKSLGDRKYNSTTNLWSKLTIGKNYKCVDVMNGYYELCMQLICPNATEDYNTDLPLTSIQHYYTDCKNGWKPKIWDIQEGQAKERAKVFDMYNQAIDYKEITEYLINNAEHLNLSLAILDSLLPYVDFNSMVVGELSAAFMSKGTGTSYPFYKNDRTAVTLREVQIYNEFLQRFIEKGQVRSKELAKSCYISPNDIPKHETMGNFCIRIVSKCYRNMLIADFVSFMAMFNVYTGYPRNQRGKGRALEAMSRLANLAVNLIEKPELEAWKQSPSLGTAFQRRDVIKERLIKLVEVCNKHNLVCVNEDSSGWDRNVHPLLISMQSTAREMNFRGMYYRNALYLSEFRLACATRSRLLANNKSMDFYGRTGSGYDDTTLQNSTCHWIIANLARSIIYGRDKLEQLYEDPDFRDFSCFIVGDDICTAVPRNSRSKMIEAYKGCGQTIHEDEKSIFGPMFIQWRLFETNGKLVISYNFPRVIRSCCSKEDEKELGIGGWIMSAYSTIANCLEYDEALAACLIWILKCDPYSLLLEYSIDAVKELVKLEDLATASKTTTFERVTGKNPQSNAGVDDWDDDYLSTIQKTCRSILSTKSDLCIKLADYFDQLNTNKVQFDLPTYFKETISKYNKVWELPPKFRCVLSKS